jgi:hypothetical protein
MIAVPAAVRIGSSMFDYRQDLIGRACLELAEECKTDVGFGAVLVKEGRIIGRGRNRRSTAEERARLSHVDYAIHAEQACILDAIDSGHDITGSEVYVLGIALKGKNKGALTIRYEPTFVCSKCPHTFVRFNIPVNIPWKGGWFRLTPEEAMEVGTRLANKGFWKEFVNGDAESIGVIA